MSIQRKVNATIGFLLLSSINGFAFNFFGKSKENDRNKPAMQFFKGTITEKQCDEIESKGKDTFTFKGQKLKVKQLKICIKHLEAKKAKIEKARELHKKNKEELKKSHKQLKDIEKKIKSRRPRTDQQSRETSAGLRELRDFQFPKSTPANITFFDGKISATDCLDAVQGGKKGGFLTVKGKALGKNGIKACSKLLGQREEMLSSANKNDKASLHKIRQTKFNMEDTEQKWRKEDRENGKALESIKEKLAKLANARDLAD